MVAEEAALALLGATSEDSPDPFRRRPSGHTDHPSYGCHTYSSPDNPFAGLVDCRDRSNLHRPRIGELAELSNLVRECP